MRLALASCALLLLAGCAQQSGTSQEQSLSAQQLDLAPVAVTSPQSSLPEDWYKQAVFMEIYVRGFNDSDGDGIGDFNGVTEKLDYLADLGIRGIWLMPMMKSQDRDHGYAVVDYRAVEPDYGSEADFKRLLDEAHRRGIGIIVDYVINHSAAQNPLFLDSAAGRGGKRNWYNWSDSYQNWPNWGNNPSWHYHDSGSYYYGIFWDQMPDFNLRNLDVVGYHQDSMRYWLNMGVDGFRFDAVGTLFENGRSGMLNQPENHQFLLNVVQPTVHAYDNRFMVCENPEDSITTARSCGSAFYFGLHGSIMASAKFERAKSRLTRDIKRAPISQMSTILANHDSFAGGRVYMQLAGDEGKYRSAATTLLTLPGIPFIYYGEEIGMAHSQDQHDPDPDHRLRTPMSWSGDPNTAGFTSGKPFRALASNVETHNVDAQLADPDSLLAHYRALIKLRNRYPALHSGSFTPLQQSNDKVLLFMRESPEQQMLVAINYSDQPQQVEHPMLDQCWQDASSSQPNTQAALTIGAHQFRAMVACR